MSKYYIGIDPGSSNGGIAVINYQGEVAMVCKCPDTDKDIMIALQPFIPGSVIEGTAVYIEKLWGHGGMMGSKASVFTQGKNYGMLLMACLALQMEIREVPPQQWQKEYSIKKEKGMLPKDWKAVLKDKAQKVFPKQQITLWSADALLIARYCYRSERGIKEPYNVTEE